MDNQEKTYEALQFSRKILLENIESLDRAIELQDGTVFTLHLVESKMDILKKIQEIEVALKLFEPEKEPDQLLPCPFCGSKDVEETVVEGERAWYVYCLGCTCRFGGYSSRLDMFPAWNSRANPQEIREDGSSKVWSEQELIEYRNEGIAIFVRKVQSQVGKESAARGYRGVDYWEAMRKMSNELGIDLGKYL